MIYSHSKLKVFQDNMNNNQHPEPYFEISKVFMEGLDIVVTGTFAHPSFLRAMAMGMCAALDWITGARSNREQDVQFSHILIGVDWEDLDPDHAWLNFRIEIAIAPSRIMALQTYDPDTLILLT